MSINISHFLSKGVLTCLDGYMNIVLGQTEEYLNGQVIYEEKASCSPLNFKHFIENFSRWIQMSEFHGSFQRDLGSAQAISRDARVHL